MTRLSPDEVSNADDSIIAALYEHGNLSKACRDLNISYSAFAVRLDKDENLAERYARAKAVGIDKMMEDILDQPVEDAAKDRLEWDKKRWHASKLHAKKYGDKLTHQGTGEDGAHKFDVAVRFE